MFVYLLTNTVNGKYYVGKTVHRNLNSYLSVKRWAARHRKTVGMPVVLAMAEYGIERFQVDVLGTADTPAELDELERLWIVLLNARDPDVGYNVCLGGSSGRLGVKTTDETKRKIGLANKGRKPRGYIRTEQHKLQLRERMKGNRLGNKFTSETARRAILNETPETKAKRIAGIQAAWDRKREIKAGYSYT